MSLSSERFGAAVANALGTGPGRSALAAQRARVLESASALAAPRFSIPRWSFAAAAAAVCVGALMLWLRKPVELSAAFHGQNVAERAVVEPRSEREALRFSDGSEVVLEPATHVRVAQLNTAQIELELDRGHVSAAIEKKGRSWSILAGPYTVRVIGTKFSVDWDRDRQAVEVAVQEGRVAVSGGDLGERGIVLDAGMHFARHQPAPAGAAAAALAVGSAAAPALESSAGPAADPPPASPARAEASWSALASKGKYKDALALAEKQGFDALVSSESESGLLLLANTARYAGAPTRAQQAFLELRQRFPGRPGAALSAFYLARVAEDSRKNLPEAARWLRTFLNESPAGDLAASARASLLGILVRMGDKTQARAVASEYLQHHPNGPHANEARAVLDQRPRP